VDTEHVQQTKFQDVSLSFSAMKRDEKIRKITHTSHYC